MNNNVYLKNLNRMMKNMRNVRKLDLILQLVHFIPFTLFIPTLSYTLSICCDDTFFDLLYGAICFELPIIFAVFEPVEIENMNSHHS